VRKAQELDADPGRLAWLARLIGQDGRPAEGLALLDPELARASGDQRIGLTPYRT
jgi:hypothetical protein